jgi:hypothetical protein
MLCPQLCVGIQPGGRFPARSADALPATLYGHCTQAINRKQPVLPGPGSGVDGVKVDGQAVVGGLGQVESGRHRSPRHMIPFN